MTGRQRREGEGARWTEKEGEEETTEGRKRKGTKEGRRKEKERGASYESNSFGFFSYNFLSSDSCFLSKLFLRIIPCTTQLNPLFSEMIVLLMQFRLIDYAMGEPVLLSTPKNESQIVV